MNHAKKTLHTSSYHTPLSLDSGANTPTTREIPRAKHGKLRQHSYRHLGGGRHREVRGGNQVGEILRLGWVD